MKIAICDDEKIYQEATKEKCLDYFKNETVIIELFSSGKEYLEANREFDLLFLDIEMPNEDGIVVKDKLEREGKETKIIFLTSHEERMKEAFGKNVIGFLSKPIDAQMFHKVITKVIFDISSEIVEVEENDIIYAIPIKTIKYIEAKDKYTLVVTQTEELLLRKTMKYWEEELQDKDFSRINKSFLLNLEYLRKDKDEILLDDDRRVKMSRKYRSQIFEEYKTFLRKKVREL